MFRWLFVCLILSGATFALVSYGVPWAQDQGYLQKGENASDPDEASPSDTGSSPKAVTSTDLPSVALMVDSQGANRARPLTIQEAHLTVVDKQEVPAEHDGPLTVVGTEILPGEKVPEGKKLVARVGYLVRAVLPGEEVAQDQLIPPFPGVSRRYRRWKEGDPLKEPGRKDPEDPKAPFLILAEENREFRRLEVGDEVKQGQMVALVDPALAIKELAIKHSVVNSAEAEVQSSLKTKEEYIRRWLAMKSSIVRVPGSVSTDDLEAAKLSAERYAQEQVSKEAAVVKAQQELLQAATVLKKHEVRAAIDGVVTIIYKLRGDAVHNLDSIMQLQNFGHLRLEGVMEVQDTLGIHKGTEVLVEPSRPEQPRLVLGGHLQEVNCVAVSAGSKPIIVSGSEDKTLRGWDGKSGRHLWTLPYNVAAKSVACTSADAKQNLLLVGWADGAAWLLDLDKIQEKAAVRPLADRHRTAVSCVAFSPDGEICATGSDDRSICLWETATGKLLYRISQAHRADITSIQFAGRDHLVSAGRDKTLALWNVAPGKPPIKAAVSDRRSGDIAQLGVSPDGKLVLFDQGKELRLLSLPDGQIQGVVQNPSGATNFTTMALFSPDGKTILTNIAGENRLQLWRTPEVQTPRAAELRQFIYGSQATCGAFAPDGSFAVTGTQDNRVVVWPLPSSEEINKKLTARLCNVEPFLQGASRLVRVFAELGNPLLDVPGRPGDKSYLLIPGGTATMVVPQR